MGTARSDALGLPVWSASCVGFDFDKVVAIDRLHEVVSLGRVLPVRGRWKRPASTEVGPPCRLYRLHLLHISVLRAEDKRVRPLAPGSASVRRRDQGHENVVEVGAFCYLCSRQQLRCGVD